MVTTAHQKASGILLKKEFSEPASAKYTALEKSTTPEMCQQKLEKRKFALVKTKIKINEINVEKSLPHVTIADRRHGDNCPPECVRYGFEKGLIGSCFSEIYCT